jgi:lipid-A-disaccharide synthase
MRFVGMGGPKMAAVGLETVKDLVGMSVVGFWEVVKQYGFFRTVFYQLLDRVKQERPISLLCIDYPGFNLRFAKEVRRLGIPVLYYITPQVWAWKEKRAKEMARYIDRVFCVFDFEPHFFNQHGLPATFVGHPLADAPPIGRSLASPVSTNEKPLIALLPGSRDLEFSALAETMVDGWKQYRTASKMNATAILSVAPSVNKIITEKAVRKTKLSESVGESNLFSLPDGGTLAIGTSRSVQRNDWQEFSSKISSVPTSLAGVSDFSIVCSGTATLEAGLAGNPMCVVYKSGRISFALAKMLVNLPVISLVNIVLGKYVVPELLQDEVNSNNLAREINCAVENKEYVLWQREALKELPNKLGGPGAASRTADGILNFLRGKPV